MRLTNRGRIACGVLATAVVLLGQHLVPAASSGPRADAAGPSAPRTPAPTTASTATAAPTAARPSATATPTPTPTLPPPPAMDMARTRDDPPVDGSAAAAPATSAPTSTPSALATLGTAAPRGTGRLVTVPGRSALGGTGPLRTYRVQVEQGIGEDGAAFAAAVQRTLTDRRSWGSRLSFRRVDSGWAAFTVVLASPQLAERLCKPLEIAYKLSCFSGGHSVVNDARWRGSAPSYGADLASYRLYVVNHEVGHALGHDHQFCGGTGQLAPVMMQQTKGIGACRPNPWPFPQG